MNITLIWNVKPCGLVKVCRRFGGTYCFHFHGRKLRKASSYLACINLKYLRDIRLKLLLLDDY
jgi:hypothetical protein